MRTPLVSVRGAALLAALFLVSACGAEGTGTPIDVDRSSDGKKTTFEVTTPEGKVTTDVDESGTKLEELGIPVPPGATMNEGDSVVTMKVPEGTSRTATFTVASSVKEIEAFYAEQFEIKMSMLSAEGGTLVAQPGEKRMVTIVIGDEEDDGRRAVSVSVVEEK